MKTQDSKEEQEILLTRLRGMGCDVRLMKGGRCVLGSMEVGPAPFEGLTGTQPIRRVLFSTMGNGRIKIMKPHWLFVLPPIRIVDCNHQSSIEARIRQAWKLHIREIRAARAWLASLGSEPTPSTGGALVSFPIDGEQGAHATMIDRQRAVLPTRGPLEGLVLEGPEDRILRLDPAIDSSIDLSIHITNRMTALARSTGDEDRRRRHADVLEAPTIALDILPPKRVHTILLVGPLLARQKKAIESLRLRGYRVATAKNEQDAIDAFDALSPELVMADIDLGRSEGFDLMVSLQEIRGIETMPVILLDEVNRTVKRDAARELGAAGYVVYPLEIPRIAGHLSSIVTRPSKRRFTRYSNRLALKIPGSTTSGLLTALSRGGMFVATDRDLPIHSLHDFELLFPEVGRSLRVSAEVIYQTAGPGRELSGVGMRFQEFADSHEALLIDYLRTLDD